MPSRKQAYLTIYHVVLSIPRTQIVTWSGQAGSTRRRCLRPSRPRRGEHQDVLGRMVGQLGSQDRGHTCLATLRPESARTSGPRTKCSGSIHGVCTPLRNELSQKGPFFKEMPPGVLKSNTPKLVLDLGGSFAIGPRGCFNQICCIYNVVGGTFGCLRCRLGFRLSFYRRFFFGGFCRFWLLVNGSFEG